METRTTELEELEKRIKQEKSRRMFERYLTIRLHLQGTEHTQIAEIVGRHVGTINSYIRAYLAHGLQGLEMKFSTGAPERLTKEQQFQLKETIIHSLPYEGGFTAKHNGTLHLIAEWVKREFGHTYTLRGISKLVHRLELGYTKPTYTLAAADKEKQAHFVKNTFPTLKKVPKQ